LIVNKLVLGFMVISPSAQFKSRATGIQRV
jgi:hypothetical protein